MTDFDKWWKEEGSTESTAHHERWIDAVSATVAANRQVEYMARLAWSAGECAAVKRMVGLFGAAS